MNRGPTVMVRHSILTAVATGMVAISPALAGELTLHLDQAQLFSVDRPIGKIVVANPSIADVSVHSKTELVMFGKMPGITNIFIFDRDGDPIKNVSIRVANEQASLVTVYAGAFRHTVSCNDKCEPTYTLGDGVNGVRGANEDILVQAQKRQRLAAESADGSTSTSAERSGNSSSPSTTSDRPEG